MLNRYRLPKVIFIVGVDGAGKTLYADMLTEALKGQGIGTLRIWSRYNNYLSKPLLALTRLTGHNYKEYHEGIEFGYHRFKRPRVLSYLFIILQIIDLNIATYFKIGRYVKKNRVLICDRGPYDTLADVMLDTGKDCLKNKYINAFFNAMPKDHVVFYIYRPLEKIYQSRPELKHDRKLPIKDRIYQKCHGYFGWKKLDNVNSPDILFEKMETCLNEKDH